MIFTTKLRTIQLPCYFYCYRECYEECMTLTKGRRTEERALLKENMDISTKADTGHRHVSSLGTHWHTKFNVKRWQYCMWLFFSHQHHYQSMRSLSTLSDEHIRSVYN